MSNDYVLIRLADMVLTKAEASFPLRDKTAAASRNSDKTKLRTRASVVSLTINF